MPLLIAWFDEGMRRRWWSSTRGAEDGVHFRREDRWRVRRRRVWWRLEEKKDREDVRWGRRERRVRFWRGVTDVRVR